MSSHETGNKIAWILKKLRDETQEKFPDGWFFYPETHLVHIQIERGKGDVILYHEESDARNLLRAMRWFFRNAGLPHYQVDIDKLSKIWLQYREELASEMEQEKMNKKGAKSQWQG